MAPIHLFNIFLCLYCFETKRDDRLYHYSVCNIVMPNQILFQVTFVLQYVLCCAVLFSKIKLIKLSSTHSFEKLRSQINDLVTIVRHGKYIADMGPKWLQKSDAVINLDIAFGKSWLSTIHEWYTDNLIYTCMISA